MVDWNKIFMKFYSVKWMVSHEQHSLKVGLQTTGHTSLCHANRFSFCKNSFCSFFLVQMKSESFMSLFVTLIYKFWWFWWSSFMVWRNSFNDTFEKGEIKLTECNVVWKKEGGKKCCKIWLKHLV